MRQKPIQIIPVAFTDHFVVSLRLRFPDPILRSRPGRWRMDPLMCHDENIRKRLGREWMEWRKHKRYYPDVLLWWERCIMKRLGTFFRRVMTERNIDLRKMETFLYTCMYDVIHSAIPEA